MVPSPPKATTAWKPRSAASRATSVAWSRDAVSTTSSLKSAWSALTITCFLRSDTDPAYAFETSKTFSTAGHATGTGREGLSSELDPPEERRSRPAGGIASGQARQRNEVELPGIGPAGGAAQPPGGGILIRAREAGE